MVPAFQKRSTMKNETLLMAQSIIQEMKGDGSKPVIISTDEWSPNYKPGDTLLLQPSKQFMAGDHAMVTTKQDKVHLGSVTKVTTSEMQFVNFGAGQRLSRVLRSEIQNAYRVVAVLKG
jgi:hypothetical protein